MSKLRRSRRVAAARDKDAVDATSLPSSLPVPLAPSSASFSFACGGWLKMYMFGVAKALQEHELDRGTRMIGCSAGALTATALALGCDFDHIRAFVLRNVVPRAHAHWRGLFQVRQYLQDTLAHAGDLHLYEQLNTDAREPKLTVVYSSLSAWASRRVTKFDSQLHLEQSLLASCCAFPIAGLPFQLNKEWVMDGGVFDFQPVLDKNTVTVSPFYCTSADIKPSRYVPMWWALHPPTSRDIEWLFDLGYEDGLAWIAKTGKAVKEIKMPTKGADYDGAWTTTVGRVVGYRGVESRFLDMLFVSLFVCLWKPLVFVLLYLELYVHAIVSGGKAAVLGAAAKFMVSCIVLAATMAGLATHSLQDTMLFVLGLLAIGVFLGVLVLVLGGIQEASRMASSDWQKCRTCMRNITSLSLFLRCVPVLGSSVQIKRHEYLLRHSMVYRLTLHFV